MKSLRMSLVYGLALLTYLIFSSCPTPISASDESLSTPQVLAPVVYYASPTGSQTNTGLSASSPWPVQYAADRTNPGDTVLFLSGTYSIAGDPWLMINRSGASASPITYKAAPGASVLVQCPNPCPAWTAVRILANYIVLDGIEFVGNNRNLTVAQGEASYNSAVAGGSDWATYAQTNTNGITIGVSSTFTPHHVTVSHCNIHDFASGGIAVDRADFITATDNIVYNNAWYGMYASSGISLLHLQNTAKRYTGTANIISRNVVFGNKTLVKWVYNQAYSDGNGIIIDDNKNSQLSRVAAYKGSTLVENNLSYGNGGHGVYVMSSRHVLLRNNTSFGNSTRNGFQVSEGELVCYDSSSITWVNNIGVADRTYGNVFGVVDDGNWGSNSQIVWKNNLTFNGTAGDPSTKFAKTTTKTATKMKMFASSNRLGTDPRFVASGSDFHLAAGSPAIDSGTKAYGFDTVDLGGLTRIEGITIDLGAYESR